MVLLLAKSAESVRSVFGRKVKPLDYRSRSYSKAFCSNSCYEAEISVILDLHDWDDEGESTECTVQCNNYSLSYSFSVCSWKHKKPECLYSKK